MPLSLEQLNQRVERSLNKIANLREEADEIRILHWISFLFP